MGVPGQAWLGSPYTDELVSSSPQACELGPIIFHVLHWGKLKQRKVVASKPLRLCPFRPRSASTEGKEQLPCAQNNDRLSSHPWLWETFSASQAGLVAPPCTCQATPPPGLSFPECSCHLIHLGTLNTQLRDASWALC